MTDSEQPTLSLLRDQLGRYPDRFATGVFNRLFGSLPALRDLFPVELQDLRTTFVQVLDHVLEAIAADDGHEELIEFLAQLGRDHRKYGVESEHYWLMYAALMAEFEAMLGSTRWTPEVEESTSHAMMLLTGVMRGAAESVTGPSRWQARVVQKFEINRERAVVRLAADGVPFPFHAGQFAEVQIPQLPHTWRNLSPATPPNENGEVEFHIHAIPGGLVSGSIVRDTKVGDIWTLGQAHGTMNVDGDRPVLMVAGGSGLAPLRAILLDLALRADAPLTHVFYGTRHPGELYELGGLAQLAQECPWLRVTAVAETEDDPWWIENAVDPRQWGVELQYGPVGDVAAWYHDWSDRQVLLSGPGPMIFHTALKLRAAGVDPANISHDPY